LPDFVPEHFWNLDLTLAGIIAKAVREFRARETGTPGSVPEGEWDTILRRIEDGFQAYYDADASVGTEPPDEALDLLKEHWGALWT